MDLLKKFVVDKSVIKMACMLLCDEFRTNDCKYDLLKSMSYIVLGESILCKKFVDGKFVYSLNTDCDFETTSLKVLVKKWFDSVYLMDLDCVLIESTLRDILVHSESYNPHMVEVAISIVSLSNLFYFGGANKCLKIDFFKV